MFKTYRTNKNLETKENVNWMLVRTNKNDVIKNYIVDEKLFAAMVANEILPSTANFSVCGDRLGWHPGEDGQIYDVFVFNKEKFFNYNWEELKHGKKTKEHMIEELKTYIYQLRKIKKGIFDNSFGSSVCQIYLRCGGGKEFCEAKAETQCYEKTL